VTARLPTQENAMQTARRRCQSGITLVECAAALAIVAVLVGVAVPRFDDLRSTHVLQTAAAQLRTDVQHARSAAVAMGQTVRLQVRSGAQGSCYVVHTGDAAACRCTPAGDAQCEAPAQLLRATSFAADQQLTLAANVQSVGFDPFQGTATPTGSVTLSNGRGDAVKVVVNVMGRARTCRAAGTIQGHPNC
jgi:type IV fimbrial biogenesis protein FimT